jgi:hypothetical protein
MEKQQSPHSWASGPPESKSESWNWERRTELLNISSGILQAQIMGSMKARPAESWEAGAAAGDPPGVDPTRAVDLARRLIAAAEDVQPKL